MNGFIKCDLIIEKLRQLMTEENESKKNMELILKCFELEKDNRAQIIHDFASEGLEQRKEYECFWVWFREAIDEMMAEVGE